MTSTGESLPKHGSDVAKDELARVNASWSAARAAYLRSILTLSSGALVLSITFVSEPEAKRLTWLLGSAWVLFGASIFFSVWAMWVGQKRFGETTLFHRADLRQERGIDEIGKRIRALHVKEDRLLLSAGWLFALGAIGLLVFALCNVLPSGEAAPNPPAVIEPGLSMKVKPKGRQYRYGGAS